MKTIHEHFEDEEHKRISKLKGKLTWRDFIMLMTIHCEEAVKKGHLKLYNR